MARPEPRSDDTPLDPEFVRILRMADPGPALDGPLTFLPASNGSPDAWLQAWTAWRDETLTVKIAPILAAVARCAERGEVREILTLDLGVAATLEPPAAIRSAANGSRLLKRLSTAQGERWLDKLQRAAAEGRTPAHFPVIYAAQSVLFHLPLRLLVPGYAYWEWTAAMSARPPAGGTLPRFAAETIGLRALADHALSSHVFDAAERFRAAANAS